MMKRLGFAVLALLLCLAGCGGERPRPGNVRPWELAEDAQEIVDLLSMGTQQEILLFAYDAPPNTTGEAMWLEVWLEVYEHGELTDKGTPMMKMSVGDVGPPSGEIAIQLWTGEETRWAIVNRAGEGGGSMMGSFATDYGQLGRAFGPLNEQIAVELGTEVVLYCAAFGNAFRTSASVPQEYMAQPELVREQEYVYLIKCKFS